MDGKNVIVNGKRYDPTAFKNAFIYEARAASMTRKGMTQYLVPGAVGLMFLLAVMALFNPEARTYYTPRNFGAVVSVAALIGWRLAGAAAPMKIPGEYHLVLENHEEKRSVLQSETRDELEPYLRVFKRHMVNQSSSLEANVYDPPKPAVQAQVQLTAPKLGR
jgi:hypothetical protein